MGGIGKSTLATILYEKISNEYDVSCFVDDISKIYRDFGPRGVQKQLLCQAFMEENFPMENLSLSNNLIQTRLRRRKALIVLDDVDQRIQLEKLAFKREWFGRGSRIIVVSRDEHILREYGADDVYKVQLLNDENALQLFCTKAFKCNHVAQDYESLTDSALAYANGLPLAIKVLGSFLFGRNVSEWSSALLRLKENPTKDIMDVLRISFDGLEDMEKEVFLDIACFFPNEWVEYVKEILRIRGFHPDIGIRILIDKSLITCNSNYIFMHDLLRELGKSIVREKSPKKPWKWSRLWNQKDLRDVMLENKAAATLKAIVLPIYPEGREELAKLTTLNVEALSKMSRLKLLMVSEVNFSGCLHFLSNELGYLEWKKYPFTCLPSSFQPNKVVKLILHHSNISELWKGIKCLHNLKHMELCHSKNLLSIPNLSEAPNLLHLDFKGCVKLVHLDPSIGSLEKLRFLNLRNCRSLVSIPNSIFDLNSLRSLNLSGCWKLLKYQLLEEPRKKMMQLKKLDTSHSVHCNMISSICKTLTRPLHFFFSRRPPNSVDLLMPSLSCFAALVNLDISFCNLVQIPDAIGQLRCLEDLNIGGNNFVMLPHCIKELPKLSQLNLEYCKNLKWLHSNLLPKGGINDENGIYVFNCPNLNDTEHCCLTVISRMIKFIKVNMQYSFPKYTIQVVIPGTKIPRWFNKQNMGDSLSLDPSPIVDDNNWIGIAACVTFVVHDTPTKLVKCRKFPTVLSCGFHVRLHRHMSNRVLIRRKKYLITTKLYHMLLIFFSREIFINDYVSFLKEGAFDLDDIELTTKTDYPGVVEVTSCGYRWVFKEDLEQLDPTMMYSANSSAQKRKFLAIEDDQ